MPHLPNTETFAKLAKDYDLVPVYRCLTSDPLTPVSAFRRLDRGGTACLFESVIGGEKVGRYSFLAVEPYAVFSAHGANVTVIQEDHRESYVSDDALEDLRKWMNRSAAVIDELPPFIGGAVGYAGYDVVRYTEQLPNSPPDDRELPDISFALYDKMVVFDHVQKTLYVLALADLSKFESVADAYVAGGKAVDELVRLREPLGAVHRSMPRDRDAAAARRPA